MAGAGLLLYVVLALVCLAVLVWVGAIMVGWDGIMAVSWLVCWVAGGSRYDREGNMRGQICIPYANSIR